MSQWARAASRRFARLGPIGRIAAAVFFGASAVMVVWAVFSWEDNYPTKSLDEIAYLVYLVLAVACAAYAARSAEGRRRYGWVALIVALSAWLIGLVVRMFEEVRGDGESWHPSLTQGFLVVFPVAAYACLLLMGDLDKAPRRRLILDSVIMATSLFVVSWVCVLRKLSDGGGAPGLTVLHITVDVILLTTAIVVWSRPLARVSVTVLAAGMATIQLADIASVYLAGVGGYHDGGLVDVVRAAGFGMLGFAALFSIDEQPAQPSAMDLQSGVRVWLPYLPLLAAGIAGVSFELSHRDHRQLFIAEAILVTAVLIRQLFVLTENQRLLAEVAREAFHDNLTGLANRANFLDKLDGAIARRRRSGEPVAVLCLDLDNFKAVNDALGHPAGDELLIRVAGRLTSVLGETWTIARLGGDEFAAIHEGHTDALAAANRVLDACRTPIILGGVPQTVRPSIGLTVAAANSVQTSDDLLLNADLAMYAAKRDGGGCVRSFVPDLPAPWELQERTAEPVERWDGVPLTGGGAAPGDGHRAGKEPSGGGGWPSPGMCVALGVLALGVAVFTASTLLRDHAGRITAFDSVMYPALNISAAAFVLLRAYQVRTERWPWLFIGAGMACSAAGDVVYAAWVPEGQILSAADPLYLAFYPLVYAGIVLLMRDRLTRVPTAFRLDALICGLTLGAVSAAVATGPINAALQGEPAAVFVGLAYPVGDLLLLALTAGMLPILGWRAELRWGLLVAGFMAFAIADTIYLFQASAGTYLEGTWVDACWLIAALLIAVSSWLSSSGASPRPKPGLAAYVPAVLCGGIALVMAVLANQSRVAVTLAALTLIAVAWRFAVTFRDVSATAEAHRQAMTDELTGLPNRRSLATTLTAVSVDESSGVFRTRSSRALLLLDIDQFREINYFAGRHVGDQLLIRIAERLSRSVRSGDVIARTGGDEFAILFADSLDVTTARARAGAMLEELRAPFELDPITLQVDASISIALYPDHCEHPNDLLNCVETTMLDARAGSSKILVHDPGKVRMEKDHDDDLIGELRAALTNDELTCYYQPKIRADNGQVHSVEALLRWRHPSRGLLLPEEFLPTAERAGLMRQIANCVVNLALGQVRAWKGDGVDMTVAVNLSVANLLDLDLVDTIDGLLKSHAVPAEALILEITEGTFANDSARTRNTVHALRRLGVRISLDDYGTGWSSLARLQDMSVDELKLDRVFVSRLAEDPRSIAIVRSTVALAHSLGADLIAEGVEDEATLLALRRYGCNITQGYVHTPPLPADELIAWIERCTPPLSVSDLALHPDLR
ncbi:bifunctional diguanylate cyclase/phosphodiesterase [Mycolicibacterium stellerae]|uniref:bifunctional diguanylate cyclase/phosphodiesterase n=1 Tax=Mycolicibacterium stellerae TaxID=2358193 RepID=UPI001F3DE0A0|nr:bifunctional diguanylate cyclase/phosphodiesterase [Mycolicibacterium stellerae]